MKKNLKTSTARYSLWVAAIFFLLFTGYADLSFASEHRVNIKALIKETQKESPVTNELSIVWWIPEEFWVVNFQQDPTTSQAQMEEFVKVLHPYTLLCVVDGKIGALGGIAYEMKTRILENILIIDEKGTRYTPLEEGNINPDARNFLGMIKPVFANMLGSLGENMHFILFPAVTDEGKRIAEAGEKGIFTVVLNNHEYRWRLPLSSLLPPKICPVDGEVMNGAWTYCPWHGTKLEALPESNAKEE